MRYLPSIIWLASLCATIFGDNRARLKFRCPRARVQGGCIHRGEYISRNECLRLCQIFYTGTEFERTVESICRNNLECECRTPPLDDADEFGFMRSLSDLQEYRDVMLLPQDPSGLERTRCGYRNEFITVNECRELCTSLQREREVIQNPITICGSYSRCKCEEPDGDQNFVFIDLDTLEARYRREIERNIARDVRIWLDLHNEMNSG